MSIQEKKEKLKAHIEYLTDSEIDLIEEFLERIQKENNLRADAEKLFADVNARYGNVLAKLAQ